MDKHQARKSILELCEQLQMLESEVQSVTNQVKSLVEDTWTVYETEIYRKLCDWQHATLSTDFYCFLVRNSVLEFQPALSSADLTQNLGPFYPFDKPEIFNSQFSDPTLDCAGMIALAFSGHEMQFEFKGKIAVLPFAFWDRAVAVFITKIPNLSLSQYESISQKSAELLVDLRAIILSDPAAQVIKFSRAS